MGMMVGRSGPFHEVGWPKEMLLNETGWAEAEFEDEYESDSIVLLIHGIPAGHNG